MKHLLTSVILFYSFTAYCQSKETSAYNKVKNLYETTSFGCIAKPRQCSIFFNKTEKGLDIIDVLIPLMDVEVKYRYSELAIEANHFVMFTCTYQYCLYNSKDNSKFKAFSVPFASKIACYNFIDAVSALKNTLEKK